MSKFFAIIVENPNILREIIFNLKSGTEQDLDEILLFNNLSIKGEKIFISDVFNLDITTQRTIQTKLNKQLFNEAVNEKNLIATEDIIEKINTFANKIIVSSQIKDLYYKKLEISRLIKALKFGFLVEPRESFVDSIISYIEILNEYLGVKVFIFLFLLTLFSEEEYRYLIAKFTQMDVEIIFIENVDTSFTENKAVITKNGAVIYD